MARGFDIERRKRPAVESPSRRSQSSSAGWLIVVTVLGIAGLFWYNHAANTRLGSSPTTTPSVSFSSQSATITPSPTDSLPAAEPSPSTSTPVAIPSVEPSPTPLVTPLETSSPKPAQITLRILNGSGTPGVANSLRFQLVKAGFTVRSVALARTRRQTTIIYYNTGKKAEAELIGKNLGARQITYEEDSSIVLTDTAVIIVGAR